MQFFINLLSGKKALVPPQPIDTQTEGVVSEQDTSDELCFQLKDLIAANRSILQALPQGVKLIDLLYVVPEKKDGVLLPFLEEVAAQSSSCIARLLVGKQSPFLAKTDVALATRVHSAAWWQRNPLANISALTVCDPVNVMPIALRQTNPCLKMFTVFTTMPRDSFLAQDFGRLSDIVFVPYGLCDLNVFAQARRVEQFSSFNELAGKMLALAGQKKWLDKLPFKRDDYVYFSDTGIELRRTLPDSIEQGANTQLVVCVKGERFRAPAPAKQDFRDVRDFHGIMRKVMPEIKGLYIRHDVYQNYQHGIERGRWSPEIFLKQALTDGLYCKHVFI